MDSYVVGLDIGGTMLKAGLFNQNGELILKKSTSTRTDIDKADFIEAIAALIEDISDAYSCRAVGIGIAGVIDDERTCLVESPNLPAFNNLPLKSLLEKRLQKTVMLENDANSAALGECWSGAGTGIDNFLLFTLGTGIGSGLILNGKLWIGEKGKAGEFGHVTVEPDGVPCACGKRGCLEAHSSGTAIVRMAREALQERAETTLRERNPSDITPEVVYQQALSGDRVSLDIFMRMAHWLAMAIANVNNLLDIHTFIVGGGVSKAHELFIPHVLQKVDQLIFGVSRGHIKLLVSKLGNDAGIYGAGYLAAAAQGE